MLERIYRTKNPAIAGKKPNRLSSLTLTQPDERPRNLNLSFDTIMSELDEVVSRIKAIRIALISFARYPAREGDRVEFLRAHLDQIPNLDIYLRFSEGELKTILKMLHDKKMKILEKGIEIQEVINQMTRPVDAIVNMTTPLCNRETVKKRSLTERLIRRCDIKQDARRCEVCNQLSAIFEAAHLFDPHREAEFEVFFAADRDHLPISINHPENGLLICRNCHGYLNKKPHPLLRITSDGTIELCGLAKEQNYENLHGVQVPWADKINQKDWPTSALLQIVYDLKTNSRKRSSTDLDEGIVDAADLPPSPGR